MLLSVTLDLEQDEVTIPPCHGIMRYGIRRVIRQHVIDAADVCLRLIQVWSVEYQYEAGSYQQDLAMDKVIRGL